jgi:hypothetical protein
MFSTRTLNFLSVGRVSFEEYLPSEECREAQLISLKALQSSLRVASSEIGFEEFG